MEGCWSLVWSELAAWSRPQIFLSAAHRYGVTSIMEAPEPSAQ